MNPGQFQRFAASAMANPSQHMEQAIVELTRLREKCKKQEVDNFRYKAVFKALLKPTPQFIEGLGNCKSYKELDMFSYVVLNNTKGSLK